MVEYAKPISIDKLKGFMAEIVKTGRLPQEYETPVLPEKMEEALGTMVVYSELYENMEGVHEDLEPYEHAYEEYRFEVVFSHAEKEDFRWIGYHTLDNGLSFYGGVLTLEGALDAFIALYQNNDGELRAFIPSNATDFDSDFIEAELRKNIWVRESFTLVEEKGETPNTFIVTIVADWNDGDYLRTEKTYSNEEFEKRILPALNHLDNFGKGRGKLRDYDNEGNLAIPQPEWESCHTLKSVTVQFVDENLKIWDVQMNYAKLPKEVEDVFFYDF